MLSQQARRASSTFNGTNLPDFNWNSFLPKKKPDDLVMGRWNSQKKGAKCKVHGPAPAGTVPGTSLLSSWAASALGVAGWLQMGS
jgi:hypothetical protein